MRRLIPLAIAATGLAAALAFALGELSREKREPARAAAAPAAAELSAVPESIATPATTTAPPAPSVDRLAEYEGLLSVQSAASDFVQTADRMSAADRERLAAVLNAQIDDLEARRMIVGAQGLYLRAAIASAQYPSDASAKEAAVAALQSRYAGASPSRAHLDESYRRLKAREREIVRDADGRAFFPNGMSKDEYLRRELDAALKDAYSSGDD